MTVEQGYLLIVEDDADILELLEMTLRIQEYRVVTAQNGREALEIVRGEPPILVIADIMMPHLDGYGLVHRLKIDPATRRIPVVFITATYVPPEDREFALKIGVARIIQKPINFAAFLETVQEFLAREPGTDDIPFDEIAYYHEYRRLLEAKLSQTARQISRDEQLLNSQPGTSGGNLRDSLRRASLERDELNLLLDEIQKQLERIGGAG
jgi:putative two-component system response regulator